MSAYYHHFISKGDAPDKAYAKVVRLFPDAVFCSYTYPKVICVNSATALLLRRDKSFQRGEAYKVRKISYEGGRKELESITAPSASEDITDCDDMDEADVLSAAAAAAEAADAAVAAADGGVAAGGDVEDMEVCSNSVTDLK